MADPTQYDYDHAAFVRQQYRYVTEEDANVAARNPQAREVSLDTNGDLASATAIALAILQENVQPRAFEVDLDGTVDGDPFAAGLPSMIVTSLKNGSDGVARKAFSLAVDFEKNATTWQVRG